MRLPPHVAEIIRESARKAGVRTGQFLARLLEAPKNTVMVPERGEKPKKNTTALNARRGDIFYIEYNDPNVIIELPGKNHILYDPRDEQPADPALVASLRLRGQEVPAEGYTLPGLRDGKQVVVLTKGRRRWKAMQAAWEEMLAEGGDVDWFPPFRLIVKKYVSDTDAFEAAIIENIYSLDDIAKGRTLQKYLDRLGHNERIRERARVIFNLKDMDEMDGLLKLAT